MADARATVNGVKAVLDDVKGWILWGTGLVLAVALGSIALNMTGFTRVPTLADAQTLVYVAGCYWLIR